VAGRRRRPPARRSQRRGRCRSCTVACDAVPCTHRRAASAPAAS
jgi:hypothetical protein